ncbi:MAG: hypothetical protein AB4290_25670 [Spirulina sp.]
MNNLSIVSIILGMLLAIGRAPFIFAPATMLRIVRNIVNKKSNLRLVGFPTLLLGTAMLAASLDANQPLALIILIPGCLIVLAGFLEIFRTSVIQRIGIYIWSMSNRTARLLGAFSVALGCLLIYLGLGVFSQF